MDMKLTTGILITAITMAAGAAGFPKAAAQNTDAIDNARSIAKSLQQKQANDSNAALDAAGVPNQAPQQAPQQTPQQPSSKPGSKPAAGAPAPAVKPAVIPSSKPAPSAAPVAEASPAAASHNKLQKVEVVQGADGVQIEIVSNHSVTPKVSKLSSPARVLVELPETISAAPQNHVSVDSAGVKDVRIGTNGKTPPTTSVVVDLEKACAYDLTPGPEGKLILTLHTDASASSSASAKTSAPAAAKTAQAAASTKTPTKTTQTKTVAAAPAPAAGQAKSASANPKSASSATQVAKSAASAPASKQSSTKVVASAVPAAKTPAAAPAPAAVPAPAEIAKAADAAKPDQKKDDKKAEDKKWAMNGKRDPFFSPVVQQNGSGCSTGKKCLEIGNINLRGVVKSDTGFIAVVTNNLNKAYFLRENDPVFNGYVVKITGDSVVFQETVQDKLGKSFTREIVKRIFTPAV
jgi:Tfp pilus assembly protein PilP